MLAIFTYGFSISEENFKDKEIELHTLSNYEVLIEQASSSKHIKEDQLKTLIEWRNNPSIWKS
jgi:orotate phosphoribosyltransferase